ncbi:MAG: galactokinase [Thermanaerothrix sp.]|uniref:Galactokinase n=2 Tax=Thermanaerothrix TaxID=1077886 RepID=A0ABU3NKJ4_9CHLR|nr:galactokinase [Thermanaerothrix sp. 4228-RoL]MDT8897376.1 galactokinase [Thermanaerothrix sp. 4228-RoL]
MERFVSTAPGRVNLLGEHVDYNQGIVLPAAVNRYVKIHARRLNEPRAILQAMDFSQQVEFSLSLEALEAREDLYGNPLPSWALYPAGVAWELLKAGYPVAGIDATYTSDVPVGAGLSSSAAVEVAFATLWKAIGMWAIRSMDLARLCQRAENDYVGVNCGLMDQFASVHGIAGHALCFDVRDLTYEAVPLPADVMLVIADSGVRRSLATSAYNERRAACEEAVERLKPHLPGIQALRDVSMGDFMRLAHLLPEMVRRRAQHVVEEIARVEAAVKALKQGDVALVGKYMQEGHRSLRDLYEVSTPELDFLVEVALNQPGCWGARLTGAGFGGCTVNLVQREWVESFVHNLKEAYQHETGRVAEVYVCQASDGASAYRIE